MKPKKSLLTSIALILIAAIGYSGFQLWAINKNYAQEAEMHEWLMEFSPVLQISNPVHADSFEEAPVPADEPMVNQSIINLQARYPDVIGWLTIPNTNINHPFVQGKDNDFYLRLDLDKNKSAAGTIFMDHRNSSDLSDFNTIIFGHNMRNGSMFGTLEKFNDTTFFGNSPLGTIFLANETHEVEFMAFMVINPDDTVIYNPILINETDKIGFLDYIKDIARHYRKLDNVTTTDRFITLSTCNYEFNNARMVLIGRLVDN